MTYYTATGNPGSLSRGASTLVRAEFALVQAGFNLLPLPAALSGGNANYVADTGIANAYVVTPASAVTAMADGMTFLVKYGNPNTGASTITVQGVTGGGSVPLVRPDGSALQLGDILAGEIILTAYSSSMGKFQLAVSSSAAIATAAASAAAAAASAAASAASSTSAQNYALSLNGTSATSLTIGTGSKSFAASTGKQWAAGSWLVAASAANSANFMYGQVTSYNSGTGALVMNIGSTGGSGTLSDWVISLSTALANTLTQAQLNAAVGTDGTLSFRNRLHNGRFTINQRNVSGSVTLAAGAYGHDRWKAGAGGCTYTFATSGADTIITISAGSLLQVVEDKDVEGGVYALSNRGTAQARIAVNGAATSGAYANATLAAPLLSATATGGQTITVEFSTGTLDRTQLEPGTAATAFQRRPAAIELEMCQRFYEKSFDTTVVTVAGAHHAFAQTAALLTGGAVRFSVTKRVQPTVAVLSPIDAASSVVGEYNNTTSAAITNRSVASVSPAPTGFFTVISAATVGNQIFFHWTASADL